MNEANGDQKQEAACGPGCNCGSVGAGTRTKWIVCGVVALAAVVTVAAHVSRTRGANGQAKPEEYSVSIPVVAPAEAATSATVNSGDAWTAPLKGLAELNVVATNTDGVFIVLPSRDAGRTAAIQKEVATAAATITARGVRMGTFLLSEDAQEYAAMAQQIGTPAVLAICKGRGMAAVSDKEVSQDALMRAFVGASRPSGCGPSGCGPGSTGCN